MIAKHLFNQQKQGVSIPWLLLTICLLLPLAFLNIKASHDWGDDFAMYLIEADHIAKHKDPAQSGFMINPNAMMGPQSYPVGFPLILAPVLKKYGLNFRVLNIYQSLMLICTLLFGFLFLCRHFSVFNSLLMTLAIAYNPVILGFKTEILSDISFWGCVNIVLCLVYYGKTTPLWMLFTGALLGFSIHIRSIGFAVLMSFILYQFLNDFKNRSFAGQGKSYLMFCLGFTLLYAGLRLLYPLNSSYQYFEGELVNTSANHLSYNLESISNFFKAANLTDYYFVTHLCAYTFLIFSLIGFFIEVKENTLSFVNVLTVIFFGVVILYHFGDAGIRLIIPLLFIFFYYFAVAFKKVLSALQFNYKVISLTGCVLLFCTYYLPFQKMRAETSNILEGPCTPESAQVFDFMKRNGIINKNVGFERPRALALFTGNNSVHLSEGHLKEEVKKYRLNYVLVHQQETNEVKKEIIYSDTLAFEKMYSNKTYELFRVK